MSIGTPSPGPPRLMKTPVAVLSPKGARVVDSNYLSVRLSEQHWG
jgi:hypothetical protein